MQYVSQSFFLVGLPALRAPILPIKRFFYQPLSLEAVAPGAEVKTT
jgi:hypothetical protein